MSTAATIAAATTAAGAVNGGAVRGLRGHETGAKAAQVRHAVHVARGLSAHELDKQLVGKVVAVLVEDVVVVALELRSQTLQNRLEVSRRAFEHAHVDRLAESSSRGILHTSK